MPIFISALSPVSGPNTVVRGPGRVRGQGLVFHRTGTADGGQQSADDHGRGWRRSGDRRKAEEAAANTGRDRSAVGGGGRAATVVRAACRRVPVRADGRVRLLRAADTGRRGRRPGRAAGGRLLRRFRPVRGQRAAADGQAVGDHRQAAGQRGAVPGPDGHAERQHAHRDAAAGQAQARQAGAAAPPPAPLLSDGRADHRRPAGRVHGDVLSARTSRHGSAWPNRFARFLRILLVCAPYSLAPTLLTRCALSDEA